MQAHARINLTACVSRAFARADSASHSRSSSAAVRSPSHSFVSPRLRHHRRFAFVIVAGSLVAVDAVALRRNTCAVCACVCVLRLGHFGYSILIEKFVNYVFVRDSFFAIFKIGDNMWHGHYVRCASLFLTLDPVRTAGL